MRKIYLSMAIVGLFLFTGCNVSNWNLGKSRVESGSTQTTQPTTPQTPSEGAQNSFQIDTVINTWGEPDFIRTNSAGSKVYVWKNCKATGKYIEKCDENSCETIAETECCERALVTDQSGYVQNLKEAVNSCM